LLMRSLGRSPASGRMAGHETKSRLAPVLIVAGMLLPLLYVTGYLIQGRYDVVDRPKQETRLSRLPNRITL
jgi:hypothetical protein